MLNASLTRLSSYRKCSKRRTLGHSAQATSLRRIDGTTKCLRRVLGFGFGSGMACVADLKLPDFDYTELKARLPARTAPGHRTAWPVCRNRAGSYADHLGACATERHQAPRDVLSVRPHARPPDRLAQSGAPNAAPLYSSASTLPRALGCTAMSKAIPPHGLSAA